MANAGLRDEEKIKDGVRRADFVRKGRNGLSSFPLGIFRSQQAADNIDCTQQRSRRCEF